MNESAEWLKAMYGLKVLKNSAEEVSKPSKVSQPFGVGRRHFSAPISAPEQWAPN